MSFSKNLCQKVIDQRVNSDLDLSHLECARKEYDNEQNASYCHLRQSSRWQLHTIALELRQQIYDFALTPDGNGQVVLSMVKRNGSSQYGLQYQHRSVFYSLALVNRQFAGELRQHFFSHHTFVLLESSFSCCNILRTFQSAIGPYNRAIIRKIVLPNFSQDPFSAMPQVAKRSRWLNEWYLFDSTKDNRCDAILREAFRLLGQFESLSYLSIGLDIVEYSPTFRSCDHIARMMPFQNGVASLLKSVKDCHMVLRIERLHLEIIFTNTFQQSQQAICKEAFRDASTIKKKEAEKDFIENLKRLITTKSLSTVYSGI